MKIAAFLAFAVVGASAFVNVPAPQGKCCATDAFRSIDRSRRLARHPWIPPRFTGQSQPRRPTGPSQFTNRSTDPIHPHDPDDSRPRGPPGGRRQEHARGGPQRVRARRPDARAVGGDQGRGRRQEGQQEAPQDQGRGACGRRDYGIERGGRDINLGVGHTAQSLLSYI